MCGGHLCAVQEQQARGEALVLAPPLRVQACQGRLGGLGERQPHSMEGHVADEPEEEEEAQGLVNTTRRTLAVRCFNHAAKRQSHLLHRLTQS